MGQNNWEPTQYSWISSDHLISGGKSNDTLCSDYVPSLFAHVSTPLKRKAIEDLERLKRSSESKKRGLENSARQEAAGVC